MMHLQVGVLGVSACVEAVIERKESWERPSLLAFYFFTHEDGSGADLRRASEFGKWGS